MNIADQNLSQVNSTILKKNTIVSALITFKVGRDLMDQSANTSGVLNNNEYGRYWEIVE